MSSATTQGPLHGALGDVVSGSEVGIRIDGRSLLVSFEVDRCEHARRADAGVGAVTSTGLLHALWLLPLHLPVPAAAVPDVKATRLRSAHGLAAKDHEGFHRLYNPAGRVTAVGVIGRNASRVLGATMLQSPVFRRVALIEARRPRTLPALIEHANASGIGLAFVVDGRTEMVVSAPAALRGGPGVFRWWIAELAYRAWNQERTQPVS